MDKAHFAAAHLLNRLYPPFGLSDREAIVSKAVQSKNKASIRLLRNLLSPGGRQFFYLTQLLSSSLLPGEQNSNLHECISY
jgi:hypothetical protein